jgi:hypothetical protein
MRNFKKIMIGIFLASLLAGFGAGDKAFADPYFLSISSDSTYPGEVAFVNIELENPEAISGYNIIISYDLSVLSIASVSTIGTRAESFEYFTYRLNYRGIIGDIGIFGLADIDNGIITENLPADSGSIVSLSFIVSTDLNYAGYAIPIRFEFRDGLLGNDNTLTNPDSSRIDRDSISYSNGYIKIRETSTGSIGDININGIPYEIGDIITLTNFFMFPGLYPLNAIQILNSDVNGDGHGATIADLVFMFNKLMYIISGKLRPGHMAAKVEITAGKDFEKQNFYYNSESDIGGLLLILKSSGNIHSSPDLFSDMEENGMIVKSSVDGDLIRILIYSDDGTRMPSGYNKFLEIDNNIEFIINDIQLSSIDGNLLKAEITGDQNNLLPEKFIIHQNYPNPFNPTTELAFSLPVSSNVKLTVYNVLGQEVKCLVDGVLTAGHHSVVWDGRDKNGKAVSSGVYFYRLSAEDYSTEKKMLLLK